MVRQVKWISSTALGLLLAWGGIPAQAQRFSFESEQSPGRSASSDDSDNDSEDSENYTPDNSDSDSNPDMPADDSSDNSYDSSQDSQRGDSSDNPTPDEQSEIIKERYPNGAVRIERQVQQDARGNYLNHGAWKMLNERGDLMAQGEYRYGNRTGVWIRWYRGASEAPLLSKPPYQQAAGPFISQATFDNDRLNGDWTIYDGKKRKISQIHFVDGKRNGKSTWWHSNGRKMREAEYRDGEIDGQFIEWGPEGAVLIKEAFEGGRKLGERTASYPGGSKKSQTMYLFAKEVEKTPDDWWNCTLATTVKTGKDEKHGAATTWHSNGQRQNEGTYEHDMQVGLFTWWHVNGQKALEGRFDSGKQDGNWTWWYATGQKSIQGEYAKGNPTGRWIWWKEDGKVAQSADLSHSEGVVVQQLPNEKPKLSPQVKKPTARQPVRR